MWQITVSMWVSGKKLSCSGANTRGLRSKASKIEISYNLPAFAVRGLRFRLNFSLGMLRNMKKQEHSFLRVAEKGFRFTADLYPQRQFISSSHTIAMPT